MYRTLSSTPLVHRTSYQSAWLFACPGARSSAALPQFFHQHYHHCEVLSQFLTVMVLLWCGSSLLIFVHSHLPYRHFCFCRPFWYVMYFTYENPLTWCLSLVRDTLSSFYKRTGYFRKHCFIPIICATIQFNCSTHSSCYSTIIGLINVAHIGSYRRPVLIIMHWCHLHFSARQPYWPNHTHWRFWHILLTLTYWHTHSTQRGIMYDCISWTPLVSICRSVPVGDI